MVLRSFESFIFAMANLTLRFVMSYPDDIHDLVAV
jgi:hypothetical protein